MHSDEVCNKQTVLAVIPARSGSKGLPDKNILPLSGKPLIAHTIKAALDSGIFNDVIVSTDSKYYAKIAREYGASVPFLRSNEASSDAASSWHVLLEVLNALKEKGIEYDLVALLQPTSPLRTAMHIKEALALYYKKKANAVISICECEYSPLLCNTLDETLSLDGFLKHDNIQRRQDMIKYYRVNGAIYLISTKLFNKNLKSFNLYKMGAYGYVMPSSASVDIDSKIDMMLAELLI
jgi:CMP-N,N'-diacetyllegionaminic acid synthase